MSRGGGDDGLSATKHECTIDVFVENYVSVFCRFLFSRRNENNARLSEF